MRWNEERTEPRRRLRSAAATLLSALVFVSGLPAEAAALSEPSGESPEEHLRGTSEVVLSDAEETAPTVLGEDAREVNAQPSEETSVPHEGSSEEVNSLAAAPSAIPEESEAVDLTQWGAIPGDPKTEWEAQLGRAREEAARLDPATLDGVPLARAYSRGSLSESIIPDFALNGLTSRGLDASWFAYTKAGEQLTVHLWAYPQPVRDNDPNYKARVTLTSPSGSSETRTIERAASSPQFAKTSTQEGVWKITIRDATPPTPIIRDLTPADIRVTTSGGTERTGRVWAERMAVDQTSIRTPRVWAMSPRGVIYQITQPGYDGVSSTWTMNNVGIHAGVRGAECKPAYRSLPEVPAIGTDAGLNPNGWFAPSTQADCDGLTAYRLFPQEPAEDLPAQITRWADSSTRPVEDRWGRVAYRAPEITNVSSERLTPGTSRARFAGRLNHQPGTIEMWIDTNNNGVFNSSVDVRMQRELLKPGSFSFTWDGNNAAGAAVPATRKVTAYFSVTNVSPIHYVREDVERAAGGIEIRAIEGGVRGPLKLYWDDRAFNDTSGDRRSRTSPRSSLNGTLSTGGVHGWYYGGNTNGGSADVPCTATGTPTNGGCANANDGTHGSWGDRRMINDWAFLEENSNAEVEVPLPALPELKIDKAQVGQPVYAADRKTAVITWDVTVRNVQRAELSSDATNVRVADVFPSGATNIERVTISQGTFNANTRVWSVGTLERNNSAGNNAASTATIRLRATVPTAAYGATSNRINRAVVNAAELSPIPTDGPCQVNTTLAGDNDRCDEVTTSLNGPVLPVLKIDKAQVGQPDYAVDRKTAVITWDVTVANVSNGTNHVAATGVTVRDRFPATARNIELVSASRGSFDAATGVWTVGRLAKNNAAGNNPNSTATIRLRATVDTAANHASVNRINRVIVNATDFPPVTIDGPCQVNATLAADSDRCDEVRTPLEGPKPGWTLEKTSDPASGTLVGAGQSITYILTVTNRGDVPMTGLTVRDDVSKITPHASVGTMPAGATRAGNTIVWTVPTVQVGRSVELRYTVTVNQDAFSQLLENRAWGVPNPADPTPPEECTATEPCKVEHPTPDWPSMELPPVGGATGAAMAAGSGLLAVLAAAAFLLAWRKHKHARAAAMTADMTTNE